MVGSLQPRFSLLLAFLPNLSPLADPSPEPPLHPVPIKFILHFRPSVLSPSGQSPSTHLSPHLNASPPLESSMRRYPTPTPLLNLSPSPSSLPSRLLHPPLLRNSSPFHLLFKNPSSRLPRRKLSLPSRPVLLPQAQTLARPSSERTREDREDFSQL